MEPANLPVSEAWPVELACPPLSRRCQRLIQQTLGLIGNKWAVPILLALRARSPLRYSVLRDALPGISTKELAKQLGALQASGLLGRTVLPSTPPQVQYWLTDLGATLHPTLEALAHWSSVHGEQVARSLASLAAQNEAPETGVLVHRIR